MPTKRRKSLFFNVTALRTAELGLAPREGAAERQQIEKLEKTIASLEHRLHQAQVIIEFQKLHDILGIPLGSPPVIEEPKRSGLSTRSRR